jgi:hypothetical protein
VLSIRTTEFNELGSTYKNDCGGANFKNGKSTKNGKIATIARRVDVEIAFSMMVFSIYL